MAAARECVEEGALDDTAVLHRRAGHVEADEGDRGVAHANVAAAIAGAIVIPRPPGPFTASTPGAISDR